MKRILVEWLFRQIRGAAVGLTCGATLSGGYRGGSRLHDVLCSDMSNGISLGLQVREVLGLGDPRLLMARSAVR